MKDKINALLIVAIGILLALSLLEIVSLTEGILAWILPLAVLAIGIMKALQAFAAPEAAMPATAK